MKKKYIVLILITISIISVNALSNNFKLDTSELSYTTNSKKDNVVSNFRKEYQLTNSISNENTELEEEIKNLTKKTTYLLFGDFNNINESSEDYYKRKQDFYALRYNPEVPKDDSNIIGLDVNSQEYKDDLISGMAIPQIFNQAAELNMLYDSYGEIRITINDSIIISSITLPKVKIKSPSKTEPMNYDYKETNYVMNYYYKQLNGQWKLYYFTTYGLYKII